MGQYLIFVNQLSNV